MEKKAKNKNNLNIIRGIVFTLEVVIILVLAYLTAYQITKVTDSMILQQWKIALIWDAIAVAVCALFFVIDKYLLKVDIDGDKFKYEMIAYTVIYMIILAIFAYMESKSIFTAVVAPIIFTPTAIVAILLACGGGAAANMAPAAKSGIKTTEYYDQYGNYKGRRTSYTGLGGLRHSYYTDEVGNIKGESTSVGNTTITKINK